LELLRRVAFEIAVVLPATLFPDSGNEDVPGILVNVSHSDIFPASGANADEALISCGFPCSFEA